MKNGCVIISVNPVSGWQPSLSIGFLLRNDLRIDAALTDKDRGNLMGLSKITEINVILEKLSKKCTKTKRIS